MRALSRVTTVAATVLVAIGALLCATAAAPPTDVRIVTIHPHDPSAFTEGLFFHGDALVESTGLNGKSFVRQYRLPTLQSASLPQLADDAPSDDGSDDTAVANSSRAAPSSAPGLFSIEKEFRFDTHMFGEGVANIGDRLYALTYKAKVVLELSMSNFTLLETHPIATSTGEGWGMTTDGELLVVSDGSSAIQFFDPRASFALVRSITVHDAATGERFDKVNELEWVPDTDEILANVWFTNHVLRINATDGAVLEVVDLEWLANMVSNVRSPEMQHSPMRRDAVMNGLALHPRSRHVFVTGKLWDSIFELSFSSVSRRAGARKPAGAREHESEGDRS